MWSTMLRSAALLLLAAITLQAYPNDHNGQFLARQLEDFDVSKEKRVIDPIGGGNLLGRSLEGFTGEETDINKRALDRIGGGNLLGRSIQDINERALDRIGGGNLLGRSVQDVESIGEGSLLEKRALDRIGGGNLLGRSLDSIGGGNLLGRSLNRFAGKSSIDSIGGGNLLGRSLNRFAGKSSIDSIGGGNLLGKRALDRIGGGNLLGRSLDSIGGGNLLGRSLDSIGGGNLLGRSLNRIPGKSSLDSIGGGNLLGRSLDSIGGGNLLGRSLDSIGGGNLLGRSLDSIGGGNLLGRSLDSIGGGNLLGRSLDRIGGGNLLGRGIVDNEDYNNDPLDENLPADQYNRPGRGFDTLKIGNTFGVAKRMQLKKQQNRRGTYNSIMGYGFGRTARRDHAIKEFPLVQSREFGQLEVAPERRNNLDPFRFGAFGAAKRSAGEQDGVQHLKPRENTSGEGADSRKQDDYTPDNYMKLFQNYPSSNTEN